MNRRKPVSDDHILAAGMTLEFLLPIGRKGVGRVWKSVAEIKEAFGLTNDRYDWWKSLGLPVHEFPDGSVLLTETDFDLWSSGRSAGGLPGPATIQTGAAQTPYLDAEAAAAYLGITVSSLYGIVERGHLVPLRGPRRRYRFTKELLDDYLRRRAERR